MYMLPASIYPLFVKCNVFCILIMRLYLFIIHILYIDDMHFKVSYIHISYNVKKTVQ